MDRFVVGILDHFDFLSALDRLTMPSTSASAPAKIILVGEHAVVYNRPAIAVPVNAVRAKVSVHPLIGQPSGIIHITAPEIHLDSVLLDLDVQHPIRAIIELTLSTLEIQQQPALGMKIVSTIPSAAGMGSSAAVSVAVVRGLTNFLGHPLPMDIVSALAYEVEKIHHGTPSGIDNTVIAYNQPIYFCKGKPVELIQLSTALTLVIADSGMAASTSAMVDGVHSRWQADAPACERLFDQIGALADLGRKALESGEHDILGKLMTENHAHLVSLGVSTPELNQLVSAALSAGAFGAKLTGSGGGGNMVALVEPHLTLDVEQALISAGAKRVITTQIRPTFSGEFSDADLPETRRISDHR